MSHKFIVPINHHVVGLWPPSTPIQPSTSLRKHPNGCSSSNPWSLVANGGIDDDKPKQWARRRTVTSQQHVLRQDGPYNRKAAISISAPASFCVQHERRTTNTTEQQHAMPNARNGTTQRERGKSATTTTNSSTGASGSPIASEATTAITSATTNSACATTTRSATSISTGAVTAAATQTAHVRDRKTSTAARHKRARKNSATAASDGLRDGE
ncbi:hypothetical protein BD410DRAFT_845156 [Rickenella mellea]|uniref:Uncharacterized protein n=1 Tax=Rickenella mellea TaxID=50990 RepID=A0A4Y7PKE1_9AGAM|nr:hypothetical protein BD410DRAFT_845156 [Rickenella mellea]